MGALLHLLFFDELCHLGVGADWLDKDDVSLPLSLLTVPGLG